ncbi:hypothetical protein TNCT_453221 [Trichonephila clavata]|uniref:Uncharacterized protein n=1 Tax=Trichonephila clavata TaxID=2740835 RepID=A0A8X6H9F2_TRICU|nr:hypothetical protein TNCT_655211 [Trichonephila clavata]GFR19214.1 hypothetical protein TNCT_453221 [Trichonephila clavata]
MGPLLDLLRKRCFLCGTIYKYAMHENALRHILEPAGRSTSHLGIKCKVQRLRSWLTSGAISLLLTSELPALKLRDTLSRLV